MKPTQWSLRSFAVILLLFAGAAAAVDPMPFSDAAEEARFRELAAELRCVMCQNQSLADSSAPIAKDLRREVFDLMREGKSDEEIKAFLVERYTDFVLYKPPLNDRTWWLWFMPVLILLAGATTVVVIVRRRAKANTASKPEPEDAW
ncbi:MAG: cytochrome c-type biogenesis protein CcmH [Xanthomonadales bacterium]|nr:cytochrome c-type biogenesis protein CcmH [Xanthomonadales bacterium]MDZ4114384.1 cytochrome c-type biogenesis protein [Xanthomonadaceae bacterium]